MRLTYGALAIAPVIFTALGCAKAGEKATDGGVGGDGGGRPDAVCADCDSDGDGVLDGTDECPGTTPGDPVNQVGCADSQLTPTLEPDFPPLGLAFTETGELGRAGGLVWDYAGIQRGDLYHIYWIVCDDPDKPCGVSLNGPIDTPTETWQYSAADSDLTGGTIVFTNTTAIKFDDGSSMAASGRMTMTIVDGSGAAIAFAKIGDLGVPARSGAYGAEILGTAYTVTALAEVKDPASGTWMPYLDYFDQAPTADGSLVFASLSGSFYDK